MRRSEIIDRERRLARPVAIAAFGVLIFIVAGIVVSTGAETIGDPELEADRLRTFAANSGTLTIAAVLSGIGYALIAPPLYYLFKAAEARSDRMRSGLIGIAVAGPLFLAIAIIVRAIAYDAVAADFVADPAVCSPATDECITDLLADNLAYSISAGLSLAGSLGIVFGMIYTSLNAMRVGLLTRFVGTLGMAVGAASVLFGPPFVALFMVPLGLLLLGVIPREKPPAWDSGEAAPWPPPGQQRSSGPDPDEPVEGRADEIFPDAAPEEEPPEPGSIAEEIDRASRSADGPQKRKRRT